MQLCYPDNAPNVALRGSRSCTQRNKENKKIMKKNPGNLLMCYDEYEVVSIIKEAELNGDDWIKKLYKECKGEWIFRYGTPNERTKIAIQRNGNVGRLMMYMSPFSQEDIIQYTSRGSIYLDEEIEELYTIKQPYYFFSFRAELAKNEGGFSVEINQSNRYERKLDSIDELRLVEVDSLEVELKWNQFIAVLLQVFGELNKNDLLPSGVVRIKDVLIHFFDTKPFVIYSLVLRLASHITKLDELEIDAIVKEKRLFLDKNIDNLSVGQIRILRKNYLSYREESMPVISSKLKVHHDIKKEVTLYKGEEKFFNLLEILRIPGKYRSIYRVGFHKIDVGILFCTYSGSHLYGLNIDSINNALMDHYGFSLFSTGQMVKDLLMLLDEIMEN